jgi:TolB protein
MRRLVVLATILAAGILAGVSYATYPGKNGLILYQANAGPHVQLFTVRADGTGVKQLTRFTDSDSLHAGWSREGSRIVFERDFANHAGLYTMNADGSDLVSLTPKGLQGTPSYSPDGSKLVYDRTLPKEDSLWIMNADGTGLRQITHNKPSGNGACNCDGSPVFSPDGKRVAFVREVTEQKTAAFVVNADASHLKQLTPWSAGVSAKLDWSPDGSRILISSPQAERPGTASNVFTIRPDGTGMKQLTHETKVDVRDLADSFSPDGKKIIYARTTNGGPFQVWSMNADGTGQKQLTHGIDAHWASWGSHP